MQAFPHHYQINATAQHTGMVSLTGDGIPELQSSPPAQFGGPGDQWSPEDLLVAAVADCFILSFRAIATGFKFDWVSLSCAVDGELDRIEKVIKFTTFTLSATLKVPAGTDMDKAQKLLEKAESSCLISNSLSATIHLKTHIVIV